MRLPRDLLDEFERLRVEHDELEREFQGLRGGARTSMAAHNTLLLRLSMHRHNLRRWREALQRTAQQAGRHVV